MTSAVSHTQTMIGFLRDPGLDRHHHRHQSETKMAQPVSTTALGRRALSLDCGVAALADEIIAIPPPPGIDQNPYGPLVGVRCGPAVQAVAYPLPARLISCDPSDTRIAIVVSRTEAPLIVDLRQDRPMTIEAELGPAVDVGRRVLGMATPAESTPPSDVLDVFWLDGIISAVLRAGPEESLSWASMSVLHPLTDDTIEPWRLRNRRLRLALGWDAFRHRASSATTRWPGMDPAIAGWLDDGSFARWCLADLPDRDTIIDDLRDLLEPSLMACIDEALAPPGEWIRRWP